MRKYDKGEICSEKHPVVKDIMDSHITETKMQNAIKSLQSNKHGLPAEILKSQAHFLSEPLCMLMNYTFDSLKSGPMD